MGRATIRAIGRRGLLAAAGGAALAAAPGRARASQGEPVLLGEVNVSSRETVLATSSTEASTLRVASGDRIAVLAQVGDAFDLGEVRAGLCAAATAGSAVAALAKGDALAMEVRGRAAFATAGLVTVPAGSSSWSIEGVPVPPGAIVLANLQSYGGPGVGIRYVARTGSDRFRVSFSAVTGRPCLLAYFVLEQVAAGPR